MLKGYIVFVYGGRGDLDPRRRAHIADEESAMSTTLVFVGATAVLSLIIGMVVGSSMAAERHVARSLNQARRQKEINEDMMRLYNRVAELNQLIREARRVLDPRKPQDR
jgi:hypothetical protein